MMGSTFSVVGRLLGGAVAVQAVSGSNAAATKKILVILGVILGLVLLVLIAAAVLHRVMHRSDTGGSMDTSAGFTLGDLRELHRQGKLSDQEFEATKALVVARSRKILDQADQEPVQGETDDSREDSPGGASDAGSADGDKP